MNDPLAKDVHYLSMQAVVKRLGLCVSAPLKVGALLVIAHAFRGLQMIYCAKVMYPTMTFYAIIA